MDMASINSRGVKICRLTPVLFTIPGIFRGQLRSLAENGCEVHLVTSPSDDAHDVEEQEKCVHHPVLITRDISPIKDLKAVFSLFLLLRRLKPSIIHTHTSKGGLIGMIAGRLAGVPLCLHSIPGFSAMEMNSIRKNIVVSAEKITFSLAHRLIPNSFSLRDFLIQEGYLPEHKVDIIGYGSSNGVDLHRFSKAENKEKRDIYRRQLGINKDEKVFLFLGRLSVEKGICELIEAFANIKRTDIHLLLTGSLETNRARLSEDVRGIIDRHPRIYLTGWTDDVSGYLSAADIMVHPTYHEGFPNALLQAGAMELPCIATNVRGCQDIIEHEKTGLLVPARDPAALQESMELLLSRPGLCRSLAENALDNIKTKWDHRVVCGMLMEYYVTLLKQKT